MNKKQKQIQNKNMIKYKERIDKNGGNGNNE